MSEIRLSTLSLAAAAVAAAAALTSPAYAFGVGSGAASTNMLGGPVRPAIGTSDRAPWDRTWPDQLPPDVDLTAEDPAVTVTYYDVEGDSREDLAKALRTQGPGETRDGRRTPSVTEVAYAVPPGDCDAAAARVAYRAVVRLPRRAEAAPLSSRVDRWWTATTRSLKIHERGRIRLARGYRDELEKSLRESRCAAARADAERTHAAFLDASARYDDLTGYGRR